MLGPFAGAKRQEKKIKEYKWEEKVKVFLFLDTIFYIRDPKYSTK